MAIVAFRHYCVIVYNTCSAVTGFWRAEQMAEY